jgi:putative methionine-R-sulfoxide reductase with GAF domain
MGRKKKTETITGACDVIVSEVVDGINDWFDDIKKTWSGTKKKKRRSKKRTISKLVTKQEDYTNRRNKQRKTIKEAIKQLEWAGYRVQKPARFGDKNDN